MKKTKLLLIWAGLLLTWCTSVQNTISPSDTSWEVLTGTDIVVTGDQQLLNTDQQWVVQISWTTDTTTTTTDQTTTQTTTATATSNKETQDNWLREKIRKLIEDRKLETKWATGLTEEDIWLMENILKEIVDSTK